MGGGGLRELLGPEALATIYEGTYELLERNPAPSTPGEGRGGGSSWIEDPVASRVYGNLAAVVEHTGSGREGPSADSGGSRVLTYINTHNFGAESASALDRSLKKSVDVLLNPLLRLIVEGGGYTTTSCCSGRTALFEKDRNFQKGGSAAYGRAGRLLYVAHAHVPRHSLPEMLKSLESNPKSKHSCYARGEGEREEETKDDSNAPSAEGGAVRAENEVVLKFEPFLIHVECSNMEDAARLLNVCKAAGLKQCGISSCRRKVIVAIRGNHILEAPVAIKSYKIERGVAHLLETRHLVTREYLQYLVEASNAKMTANMYQYLRLYHRLSRSRKIDLSLEALELGVCSGKDGQGAARADRRPGEETSIDIIGTSRLVREDKLSLPLGVESKVAVMSFGADSSHLLRWRCRMASSERFVVLLGGYEKSKGRTMCVCDLNNLQRGFKVLEIGESGPQALLDSDLISDGTVFISFGGRKNTAECSDDVFLLHVHTQGGQIEAEWRRCELKGDLKPAKRFRHSICLENTREVGAAGPGNCTRHATRFYLSGGASSCSDLDGSLLGDIWRGSLTYLIQDQKIASAAVEWERTGHDLPLNWSSGSLAHSTRHHCLFLVGGYTDLEGLLGREDRRIDRLLKYDLERNRLSLVPVRSTDHACGAEYGSEGAEPELVKGACMAEPGRLSDPVHGLPHWNMSHCLVRITDHEYFMVGGLGGLEHRDELWYLNLSQGLWHRALTLPPGTRAGFGACMVSYRQGECLHRELWMAGGGMPVTVTYGSIFDPPLRVVLSCQGKCAESAGSQQGEASPGATTHQSDNGLYIIAEDASEVKQLKNSCEEARIFDRSRRIVRLEGEHTYSFHAATCRGGTSGKKCPECSSNRACAHCGSCSACRHTHLSSLRECFLLPVSTSTDGTNLSHRPALRLFSTSALKKKTPAQNPKLKLLSLLEGHPLRENIRSVSVVGGVLLISLWREQDLGQVDWASISSQFNVTSVSLAGEIEGQKRLRHSRLLFGTGDVSVSENGVQYRFNVATNMFSKGNSAERIRIVKEYFQASRGQAVRPTLARRPELVVDFFCGIGYFSLPILKFTDAGQVSRLLCVDVNADAIRYLLENADANGVDKSRLEAHMEDCSNFGLTFGAEYEGRADRVLLGLLPSSRVGWIPALRALNRAEGGVLHVHGITRNKTPPEIGPVRTDRPWSEFGVSVAYTDEDYERDRKAEENCAHFSLYALRAFYELCKSREVTGGGEWLLEVLRVQTVKHYSPHKYHQVVDLKVSPALRT